MIAEAIKCPGCGAKIRGDRAICPRCLAPCAAVTKAAPATGPAAAAGASRLDLALVGLLVLTVLLGGYAWMAGSPSSETPEAAAAATPRTAPISDAEVAPSNAPVASATAVAPPPAIDGDAVTTAADAYRTGDLTSALEHYDSALERNPDDAESLSNKGQVLVRQGQVEEALPYFDRAISLIPQRWAYRFNRARALGILNRWPEAVAGYREAQGLFPNDYATTFNLGQALHRSGDERGAVAEYRKAIELSPADASFHLALGTSLERLQEPRQAADAYGEYLRLAPAAPEAEQVRARIVALTSPGGTKSAAEIASR